MSQQPLESKPSPAPGNALPPCVEVAIAVVFEGEGDAAKLLICKRKADTVLGGYWEFPGGKCHAGEAPDHCATREVEEETGLHVQVIGALPTIEHTYPHGRVHLHPFVCQQVGGTLELRAVAEARWIQPAAVETYQFPEANDVLLGRVRYGKEALLQWAQAGRLS